MSVVGTTGFGTSTAPRSSGEMRFNGATSQPRATATSGFIGNLNAYSVVIGYRSTTTAIQTLYTEVDADFSTYMRVRLNDPSVNEISFVMHDDASGFGGMSNTSETPSNGLLHYIAAVQSSKSARGLYFDGRSIGTNATTMGTFTFTNRVVGNGGSLTTALDGALEEVMIYTRALSTSEILWLSHSARLGHPELLSYKQSAPPMSLIAMLGQFFRFFP
jgi:hypothetical protein